MTTHGIYIHIPFCVKKCNYCAFLSAPADEETREEYVQALIQEIEQVSCQGLFKGSENECKVNFTYDTIYIGGGTPSVLSTDQLNRIMTAIRSSFSIAEDAEITLEANPGTLGDCDEDVKNTLHQYREMGINRLSMGVQSMNDEVLKFIGRIHSADDVKRDYRIAREVGFDNISLDLILSLPFEAGKGDASASHDLAIESLRELISMGPEHISCYSLQIEEGTAFGRMYDKGLLCEISDEDDRATYHEVCRILAESGYEHYEISNFGLPDRHSRHNFSYWNMSDYLAFGLGASGFVSGMRYRNSESMDEYLDGISRGVPACEEIHHNSERDNISEAVFTGLRRAEGIRYDEAVKWLGSSDETDPSAKFWSYYSDARSEAESFVKSGHLIIDDDGLRITEAGIDISNAIMSLFV